MWCVHRDGTLTLPQIRERLPLLSLISGMLSDVHTKGGPFSKDVLSGFSLFDINLRRHGSYFL